MEIDNLPNNTPVGNCHMNRRIPPGPPKKTTAPSSLTAPLRSDPGLRRVKASFQCTADTKSLVALVPVQPILPLPRARRGRSSVVSTGCGGDRRNIGRGSIRQASPGVTRSATKCVIGCQICPCPSPNTPSPSNQQRFRRLSCCYHPVGRTFHPELPGVGMKGMGGT